MMTGATVAQICNRQGVRTFPEFWRCDWSAEFNSATQQIGNLRYGSSVKMHLPVAATSNILCTFEFCPLS